MGVKYSIKHFANTYSVVDSIIEEWCTVNLGKIPEFLDAKFNNEIAKYLNVPIKSLKTITVESGEKSSVVSKTNRNKRLKKISIESQIKDFFDKISGLIYYELMIEHVEAFRNNLLFKSSDFESHNLKLNFILNKAPRIEEIIKKIEKASYKESVEEIYLDTFSKINSYNQNTIFLQKLISAYNSLPSVNEYKEKCEKKYFSWNHIIFHKKGFKIDPNIAFVSVEIDGPISILNQIDTMFFEEKYGKKAFKLYVNKTNNKVDLSISNDLIYIKNIIYTHLDNLCEQNKQVSQLQIQKRKIFFNAEISDINSISLVQVSDLKEFFSENEYLPIICKFLGKKDTIIALWENNNGLFEEALVFKLIRDKYVFFIWENINANRACYLFRLPYENSSENLIRLKKIINSNIEYKRHNLFNKVKLDFLDSTFNDYEVISHENQDTFEDKLKKILIS